MIVQHWPGCQPSTDWNILFRRLKLQRRGLSPPTRAPTSAPLNKAGDADVGVELLTGTTGVQPVPMHLWWASWWMAHRCWCCYSGVVWKMRWRGRVCEHLHHVSFSLDSCLFGVVSFLNHLPLSLLEFHFMEEEWSLFCVSCQGRQLLFPCVWGEIKALCRKCSLLQSFWGKYCLDYFIFTSKLMYFLSQCVLLFHIFLLCPLSVWPLYTFFRFLYVVFYPTSKPCRALWLTRIM